MSLMREAPIAVTKIEIEIAGLVHLSRFADASRVVLVLHLEDGRTYRIGMPDASGSLSLPAMLVSAELASGQDD